MTSRERAHQAAEDSVAVERTTTILTESLRRLIGYASVEERKSKSQIMREALREWLYKRGYLADDPGPGHDAARG